MVDGDSVIQKELNKPLTDISLKDVLRLCGDDVEGFAVITDKHNLNNKNLLHGFIERFKYNLPVVVSGDLPLEESLTVFCASNISIVVVDTPITQADIQYLRLRVRDARKPLTLILTEKVNYIS